MSSSSSPLIFVAILFLEVVLIFSLATPEFVKDARINEHNSAVHLMGDESAEKAVEFARDHFNAHFVETGLLNNVRRTLVPTRENKAKATGLEDFVPSVFKWADERLEGLWGIVFGAYHRVYVMGAIGLICLPIVSGALIDGLVVRRITIMRNEVGKPVFFHGAKKAAMAMSLMPLILLLYPATLNPSIWWAWILIFPAILWVQAANVQEL